MVGSVSRDGVQWNYNYTNPAYYAGPDGYLYDNVNVTGPNGYHKIYTMKHTNSLSWVGTRNLISSVTDELNRKTSFEYEATAGVHGSDVRVVKVTLPEGNYTSIQYDDAGNIITKTTTSKPGSGLPTVTEQAFVDLSPYYKGDYLNCRQTVLCYRPKWYKDALYRQTDFSYNANGQVTQQLDPADQAGVRRQTDITYTTSAGGISRKTLVRVCGNTTTCAGNAESHTEYTYWGETDLPQTVTQKDEATGATRTTTYSYDNAGRITMIDGPLPGTADAKYFQYEPLTGRKTLEIGAADANGIRAAKRFTYRNSDEKVTKVESGTTSCSNNCATDALTLNVLETADTTYDSRRYAIRETTSSGGTIYRVTDRAFLDRGLADCTTVRMNLDALPTATATGACALGTVGTHGPDRITKNVYDNAGQLLKVQKAYGVTTANGFPATLQQDYVTYAYTDNGKQQYVTDANGNKAQYKYDGFDRLQCWIFPSKTAVGSVSGDCVTTGDYEKYGYDAVGNRTSLRKRDGSTLIYTYDNLNRVITKTVPSRADLTSAHTRSVYTTYDVLGRQKQVAFDAFSGTDGITNMYDGFGDLTSSQISMAGFTKSITSPESDYDAAGRRTKVTPDGQAFTYAYDARDRLTDIYEGTATPLDHFAYNSDGTPASRAEGATGTTATVTYTWDAIGRLTNQTDAFPSATGSNVSWAFTSGDPNPARKFNPASQIVNESRDNDAYAWRGAFAVNRGYAVNGLNQYTTAGTASFTYDANGNLTADGTNTYLYDIENRLVKMTAGSVTTNLTYDPLGRLWQVVKGGADTRFLYDGDALVAEYDSGGNLTNRYVHGSNAAADDPLVWYVGAGTSTKRFLHADHLGSIVAVTNSSGGPTINTYDEYGIPGANNNGRFQYTGQAWLSELGMY
jgi:YD repeat-containing protein